MKGERGEGEVAAVFGLCIIGVAIYGVVLLFAFVAQNIEVIVPIAIVLVFLILFICYQISFRNSHQKFQHNIRVHCLLDERHFFDWTFSLQLQNTTSFSRKGRYEFICRDAEATLSQCLHKLTVQGWKKNWKEARYYLEEAEGKVHYALGESGRQNDYSHSNLKIVAYETNADVEFLETHEALDRSVKNLKRVQEGSARHKRSNRDLEHFIEMLESAYYDKEVNRAFRDE